MPVLFLTTSLRDSVSVALLNNEINSSPEFSVLQSVVKLPLFVRSPILRIGFEDDVLVVFTSSLLSSSVISRIGTILTYSLSFPCRDGRIEVEFDPCSTARRVHHRSLRDSAMSLCMAMDCVMVDSPEEVLILSSLLHVTGRVCVKGLQWCAAGVYGVTVVRKESVIVEKEEEGVTSGKEKGITTGKEKNATTEQEKSVITRMNYCGDVEEETVLEESM